MELDTLIRNSFFNQMMVDIYMFITFMKYGINRKFLCTHIIIKNVVQLNLLVNSHDQFLRYMISLAASAIAIYSVSVLNNVTVFCIELPNNLNI